MFQWSTSTPPNSHEYINKVLFPYSFALNGGTNKSAAPP